MARYGTQTCSNCLGYGIELRPTEIAKIKKAILANATPDSVSRLDDAVIQCPYCGGTGWVFVKNYSRITLPIHTRKRW